MGTKNNPGDFDCYANAEPDEPMFVLLARDENASAIVRAWVWRRHERKVAAAFPEAVPLLDDKAREALACARAMDEWRRWR